MNDYTELQRDAQDQIGGHDVTCDPAAVLALIADLKVSNSVGRALGETLGSVVESRDALVRVVDQLKVESERIHEAHNQICTNYNQVSYASEERGKQIDQLKAENEALRKDAERLRWLRTNEFDIGSYHGTHEYNASAWFEHISDQEIDLMIAEDAQFAKESGQ